MTTAVILAGGKAERFPRHLKFSFLKFNRVIDNSINACLKAGIQFCIVCDRSNVQLTEYLTRKYANINILYPKDDLMISSFEVAFNHDNYRSDKVIIAGDLLKISSETLKVLMRYEDRDALCTMKKPWDKATHLIGGDKNLNLRTDVGLGIFLISKSSQRLFSDDNFLEQALELRSRFKGEMAFNESTANDVWTWMLFYLFDEIYGHDSGIKNKSKQCLLDLKVSTADDYDPK